MDKKKRILVICPFPEGVAAGQRLKYEQYIKYWIAEGYEVTISSFSDHKLWNIQYQKKFYFLKIVGTLRGYLTRFKNIFSLHNYEIIYVFMWVTPFGSSLFERIFCFLSKKIIQTLQIANDIIIYNVVHTGAKTQLGGLKLGSTISEYQGSLKYAVVKPPMTDAKKVITSIINKEKYLFLVM